MHGYASDIKENITCIDMHTQTLCNSKLCVTKYFVIFRIKNQLDLLMEMQNTYLKFAPKERLIQY